jgi:hypothetical protein
MKYFYKVTMVVSTSIAVLFAYWAGIHTGLSDTGNWGIIAQMLPDGEFGFLSVFLLVFAFAQYLILQDYINDLRMELELNEFIRSSAKETKDWGDAWRIANK